MSFLRLGESERSAARSSSQAGQPYSSICTIKDSPLLNFDRNSGNEILIGSELVRTDEKRAKRDSDQIRIRTACFLMGPPNSIKVNYFI